MSLEQALEGLKVMGLYLGGMYVFMYGTSVTLNYFHGKEMQQYRNPLKRIYKSLKPGNWSNLSPF